MPERLDAAAFQYATKIYDTEFQNILTGITDCYKLIRESNVKLPNDENKIRDILVKNYLHNKMIRDIIGFTGKYDITREVPEDNDLGRVDIRISSLNTLYEPDAYYIIECKRLDNQNTTGTSGLNAKYIEKGIKRFTDRKYTAYYRINGMFGFVVAQMDINNNIAYINHLLKNNFPCINTVTSLTATNFINDYQYQYYSLHKDIMNAEVKLYHLMYDFSD